MKIVWLASWYPNPDNPFDGDFVQRHAKALAMVNPVTVFYVSQSGLHKQECRDTEKKNDGVIERIIAFKFKATGFAIVDKLVYNWKYYRVYKKVIANYFKKEGLPDIVHVHVPMKAGMIARWIKRKWNIPFVMTEHSAHYAMGTDDDFFKKGIIHKHNVSRIFRQAEVVTNVSSFFAERLKNIFSLRNIRVIHNAVNTDLFNYQPSDQVRFRFIHVSTLSEHQKNIKGILNATQGLLQVRTDFELVIVGPAEEELRKVVSELSLEGNVLFTGEIPYAEVANQMQQASALVLFSRYENSPCAIIEALCCGLPVISSDVGGINEIIDETNGILITSQNESELTSAMNRMMSNYKNYGQKDIAEKAKDKFSYNTIGNQFYNIYTQVLKK